MQVIGRVSVTEAGRRGLSALLAEAESGDEIVVERRGKPVAAIVGMHRLDEIAALEADLRSAALVMSRMLTDDGARIGLADVIASLGYDVDTLRAEVAEEQRR